MHVRVEMSWKEAKNGKKTKIFQIFEIFFHIQLYRIPNDYQLKEKWVESIRAGNNDMYEGGGFVCQGHFASEDIIHNANTIRLKKGSIPSIFLVEVIEATENTAVDQCNECEKCALIEIERKQLFNQLTKMNIDSQIQEQKLNLKIETQQTIIKAKSKERNQLAALKKKNADLREQLLISKTAPGLNVIFCICIVFVPIII